MEAPVGCAEKAVTVNAAIAAVKNREEYRRIWG
jgi:hypothetical protein